MGEIKKCIRRLRYLVPDRIWQGLRAAHNRANAVKVEQICLQNMVAASARTPGEVSLPAIPRHRLGCLLLIADVMWEVNELVPELERIGSVRVHDLHPVIVGGGFAERPKRVLRSIEGLRFAAGSEPDAVLLYIRGNLLSEELFDALRSKVSCPIIGMNLDDKVSFWDYGSSGGGDHHRFWAPKFDLNLTNSRIAESWYHEAGAACRFMAPALRRCDHLSEPADSGFSHLLGFVGSPKLDRTALVDRLRSAGLPVSVFGKGWPEGSWVDEPVAIYRATQINLGLGMATPNMATMKNRDFECPGVGACYLTTFNWELAEFWDIGREILCYRNTEELMEIACWYRNRPDACLAIARAAWKRGQSEHTWEQRFRKVFAELGFAV
jgi:hypothetical protein